MKRYIRNAILYTIIYLGTLLVVFLPKTAVNASTIPKVSFKEDAKLSYYLFNYASMTTNELIYNINEKKIGLNIDVKNATSSKLVWHPRFTNEWYYTFELIRDGKAILSYTANGDVSLEEFYNFLGKSEGLAISYGDVIHSQIAEFRQSFASTNYEIPATTLGKDAYFKLTEKGMINLKDSLVYQSYDYNSALNYISFNNGNTTNAAITTFSESDYTMIHRNFQNEIYHSVTQYDISQHDLNNIICNNEGLGNYKNIAYLSKFTDFKPTYGSVYKIYNAEISKAKIYHNGELKYSGSKDFTNTDYFEYTDTQGLVKLNFDKVLGKTKQIELNSNLSKISPSDNFTDANLYKDIEVVSFGKVLSNNVLGTYELPIVLKQKLSTNSNYINFKVNSKVQVVDTTPPTAEPVQQEVYQGDAFNKTPLSLVTNLKDNDAIENITAKITKMPDTSKVGTTAAEVEISDKSGNKNSISVPVVVKSKNSILKILFINEANQVLTGYTVTINTQVGDTINLTKNEDVQTQLTNVMAAGYDIAERPVNEDGITIDAISVTVQYKVQGVLSLTSIPSVLNFGTLTYDATTKRIEDPTLDKQLVVTDTRADAMNGWRMTASLSTPMRNSNGQELVDALRYVHKGKETILNQAAQVIYANTKGTAGRYIISHDWGTASNTDGIKLQINSSDTVYTGDYVGVITWKVMAGQP